jgi:hypothetical protein
MQTRYLRVTLHHQQPCALLRTKMNDADVERWPISISMLKSGVLRERKPGTRDVLLGLDPATFVCGEDLRRQTTTAGLYGLFV